ncbi:hypothetical protein [Acinetobacter sp. A2]|uniref:hypothetical protein n=1 Tax=Acinetobacter sp. A2 TaxID=362457 RepID=UPI003AF3B565
MLHTFTKPKIILFWSTFAILVGSICMTFIFESHLSHGLAISSSILAGIAMFVTAAILVLETVLAICNP